MPNFKLPRRTSFGLLAFALAGSVLCGPGAKAADLDPGYADIPASIPQQVVSFGSGWYIRGDVSVTELPDATLSGGAANVPPTVVLKSGGTHLGYTLSGGGGYAFTNWFRVDAIFDYHQPVGVRKPGGFFPASSTGIIENDAGTCQTGYQSVATDITATTVLSRPYYSDCSNQYQAKINSYDVLLNGYIDLGHWWIATPYVGAGVGVSFGNYSASSSYYLADGTPYNTYFSNNSGVQIHGYKDASTTANYYNLAFALMAGMAFDVTDHAKLDIGYRYLNLGRVLGSTLTYQEARAGIRYMIDN